MTEANEVSTTNDRDVGDQPLVKPPDLSVVHVADEDATYEQAKQWHALMGDRLGRSHVFGWLMANDPMVAGIYRRLAAMSVPENERDMAAVLMLAKAMRLKSVERS